jgi:RNA polymerase sigma factor (sigma-70 family)
MDCQDVDDVQLLLSLQRGDEHAFWTLWLKHSPRLFAVCLREMSGNRVEAEDALHEALLRAHDRMPRFAVRILSPASWLIRTTSNVCKDIHRHRARCNQTAERLEALESHRVQMPEVWHAHSESEEYDAAVLVALLPDRLRDVFILRVLQHASYPDIAMRFGLTCVTVRKRVQQSRATLRAWRLQNRTGNARGTVRSTLRA